MSYCRVLQHPLPFHLYSYVCTHGRASQALYLFPRYHYIEFLSAISSRHANLFLLSSDVLPLLLSPATSNAFFLDVKSLSTVLCANLSLLYFVWISLPCKSSSASSDLQNEPAPSSSPLSPSTHVHLCHCCLLWYSTSSDFRANKLLLLQPFVSMNARSNQPSPLSSCHDWPSSWWMFSPGVIASQPKCLSCKSTLCSLSQPATPLSSEMDCQTLCQGQFLHHPRSSGTDQNCLSLTHISWPLSMMVLPTLALQNSLKLHLFYSHKRFFSASRVFFSFSLKILSFCCCCCCCSFQTVAAAPVIAAAAFVVALVYSNPTNQVLPYSTGGHLHILVRMYSSASLLPVVCAHSEARQASQPAHPLLLLLPLPLLHPKKNPGVSASSLRCGNSPPLVPL